MGKKGSATAKIGLDYSAFEAGAKAVEKAVNNLNATVKTIATVTGAAYLFGKAIDGANSFRNSIKDNIVATLQWGEELANLAHGTGAFAGQLYTLQFAFEKGISNATAMRLLGNEAKLLNENAGVFRDASIKLAVVGERANGFWLGVTSKVAPLLDRIFDKITAMDFSAWGERIAEPFAKIGNVLVDAFTDGRLGDALMDVADLLGEAILESVMVALSKIFDFIKDQLGIISGTEAFNKMFGTDFKDEEPEQKDPFAGTKSKYDDLLGKYSHPYGIDTQPFEFAKQYKNFSVDSLQAIGGGGGVGSVSLADTALRQLNVQSQMLDVLRDLARNNPLSGVPLVGSTTDSGRVGYSMFQNASGGDF